MISIELFENYCKEKNGLLTFSDLTDLGLNQRHIKNLIDEKLIIRVKRGIYYHKDYFIDELKINQMDNSKMIYSNETASFLHELTDRFPRIHTVTTAAGHHLRLDNKFKIYYVKNEIVDLGVMELKNPSGNFVRVYDKERTVCDIIKNKERIEMQVYIQVIQNYFRGNTDMNKISRYAQKLGISKKILEIATFMMRP